MLYTKQTAIPNPVSQTTTSSLHTVLLATDGSSYADRALDNAIRMTKNSKGRLVITYFANPDDTALFDGFPCQDNQEWQAYGQNVLNRLAERARKAGVIDIVTVLEHYQGEESLTALSQKVDADIIILASHLFKANQG
jgi:nucleotide-binding universal stress UspA family protein